MIKYVILLFNTVALLIYQFFFADGISITQKAPASAKPGTEFTVELTIKKGDADGFAKLQQELPDGFEATEGTTSGSSFSFTDNKVKFIWMAMPNEKEFKVSYKVKVDASIITGDKFIAGKFAYVVNNVKQQVEISPVTINISANPTVNAVATNNPTPKVVAPPAAEDNRIAVSGTYLDDKDMPIVGLKVYLRNDKGKVIETATTDSLGCFTFSKLSGDKNSLVAIDESDTHLIGKKSKANYKNTKGDVVLTKDLTGNAPAVAANTPPAATKDSTPATTSVAPPVVTPPTTTKNPPATTTTETPVAYAPPSVTNSQPTTTEATAPPVVNNNPPQTTTAVEPPATNTTQPEVAKSTNTESNGLTCSRNVTPGATDNTYNVEITINKGNISGFAKYIEVLPPGFVASASESSGASFSYADGKVKYVWVSLPNTNTVKLTYKVTLAAGVTGTPVIDGSFSYIENDETKKFALPSTTVAVSGNTTAPPVATNTPPTTTTDTPKTNAVTPPVATTETPIATNVTPPTTTTETPVATNVTPPTNVVPPPTITADTPVTTASVGNVTPDKKATELSASNIPNSQGDVAYAVQIAALHNPRTPENLASMYNIKDKVKTEMADGFTKYTVGSHKVYKEAHDARDQIKIKGITDAWVTAYNKGKRITVQEALMITSQKWYK